MSRSTQTPTRTFPPVRTENQEILLALKSVSLELRNQLEMDLTYETEHISEEAVATLSRAEMILNKYGLLNDGLRL